MRRTNKSISARLDSQYFTHRPLRRRGRLLLGIAVTAIAAGWAGFAAVSPNSLAHTPGELTGNHQLWASDCTVCHGVEADGAFSLAVTDASCVTCHSAPLHHANQAMFVSADDPDMSSQCMACHIEHRGEDMLLGMSDATCTQCHADLDTAVVDASAVGISRQITAFTGSDEDHPPFGEHLETTGEDGVSVMVDPTALKFNHAVHAGLGLTDCVACHTTSDPPLTSASPGERETPPWTTDGDRPEGWRGIPDGAYMQPISYARHCAACHELAAAPPVAGQDADDPLAALLALPHEEWSQVRAQIRALPAEVADRLAFAENRDELLVEEVAADAGGSGRGRGRRPTETETRQLTPEQFVENKLADWLGRYESKRHAQPGNEDGDNYLAFKSRLEDADAWDPALVEYAALFSPVVGQPGCVLCHDLNASADTITPADLADVRTVPTGIPESPRRWFPASEFDHHAHRMMSCLDCHGEALTSQATADLLQPTMLQCATCHHQDDARAEVVDQLAAAGLSSSPDAAPSSCQVCHTFHARDALNPAAQLPGAPQVTLRVADLFGDAASEPPVAADVEE